MNNNSKFKEFICSKAGSIIMIALLYAIIISLIPVFLSTDLEFLLLIEILAFSVCGWKALNRITPDIFLIMPIGHWAIYILIKGLLSAMCGVFVAPFVISKKIISLIQEGIKKHDDVQ